MLGGLRPPKPPVFEGCLGDFFCVHSVFVPTPSTGRVEGVHASDSFGLDPLRQLVLGVTGEKPPDKSPPVKSRPVKS